MREKRRRLWRFVALALAVPLVAIVVFYVYANWQGAREWRRVKARLEAAGETFDLQALCLAPVPDAENFCAIPALRGVLLDWDSPDSREGAARERWLGVTFGDGDYRNLRPAIGAWMAGEKTDLASWIEFLEDNATLKPPAEGAPGERVLAALSVHDEFFAELAAELDRPRAQWLPRPPELGDDPIEQLRERPQFDGTFEVSELLRLRASAAVAAGDGKTAFESIAIGLRIGEAWQGESAMSYCQVGRNAAVEAMQPLWEALVARTFSDGQMHRLQALLARQRPREETMLWLRWWMAADANYKGILRTESREEFADTLEMIDWPVASGWLGGLELRRWGLHVMPPGMFDEARALFSEWLVDEVIGPFEAGNGDWSVFAAFDPVAEYTAMEKRSWLAAFPIHVAFVMAVFRFEDAYFDAVFRLATVALALERWHLRDGTYPDRLEALVPDFLDTVPRDIIGGNALRYGRDPANGRYRLWSIAWDGSDEGGVAGPPVLDVGRAEESISSKLYQGDWGWSYPADEAVETEASEP